MQCSDLDKETEQNEDSGLTWAKYRLKDKKVV